MNDTDLSTSPDMQRPCRQRYSEPMESPSTPTPQSDVLDIRALAALLMIHRVTATLKAQAGEIPGRQVGNRWRFSRKAIMQWLENPSASA